MRGQLIDGKAIAAKVRAEVAFQLPALRARLGRSPGLTVVRVGDDPASAVYVNAKERIAKELGFASAQHHLPAATSESELLALIHTLNEQTEVDGILVQLPLPKHIDATKVLQAIDPAKDVDGFSPTNAGILAQGRPAMTPCTPAGVMRMLAEIGFAVAGKQCLVVGRSLIVGRPMATLLLNASATVTIAHSKSDVMAETRRAELVIAACGVPGLIRGDWIRDGAVVVDVGINRMPDGKLRGDVDFESARARASWITPVPGGVGPMTIAMLMSNTLKAAQAVRTHPSSSKE